MRPIGPIALPLPAGRMKKALREIAGRYHQQVTVKPESARVPDFRRPVVGQRSSYP